MQLTKLCRLSYHGAVKEGRAIDEVRIRLLRPGQSLQLRVNAGKAVMCCAGSIRITQAGDSKAAERILLTGERLTFEVAGVAMLTALEGMKGEWLEDTEIVLVCLPMSPK